MKLLKRQTQSYELQLDTQTHRRSVGKPHVRGPYRLLCEASERLGPTV